MSDKKKASVCSSGLFPPETVTAESLPGVEQRAVPADAAHGSGAVQRFGALIRQRLEMLAKDFPDYDGDECSAILRIEIESISELEAEFGAAGGNGEVRHGGPDDSK